MGTAGLACVFAGVCGGTGFACDIYHLAGWSVVLAGSMKIQKHSARFSLQVIKGSKII